jgi:broad specificity phosphatase PhoE
MKWPANLVIVRHGQSTYNELRDRKAQDPEYREFKKLFAKKGGHRLPETRALAERMRGRFSLGLSDYDTPLSGEGWGQSYRLGSKVLTVAPAPDVVYVSPYLRTRQTFEGMKRGGFEIGSAKIVHGEDRIREQEHGLALLYNDWRLFQTFHPEQRDLQDLMGPYWYPFPQGESICDVRDRIRSFLSTLIREHPEQTVYLITHHLTVLSIRAILERLSPEQFVDLDNNNKPINCGVTIYNGNPNAGGNGKLELAGYNLRLY